MSSSGASERRPRRGCDMFDSSGSDDSRDDEGGGRMGATATAAAAAVAKRNGEESPQRRGRRRRHRSRSSSWSSSRSGSRSRSRTRSPRSRTRSPRSRSRSRSSSRSRHYDDKSHPRRHERRSRGHYDSRSSDSKRTSRNSRRRMRKRDENENHHERESSDHRGKHGDSRRSRDEEMHDPDAHCNKTHCVVLLSGLRKSVGVADIKAFVSDFRIKNVVAFMLITNADTGKSSGFALVRFAQPADANAFISKYRNYKNKKYFEFSSSVLKAPQDAHSEWMCLNCDNTNLAKDDFCRNCSHDKAVLLDPSTIRELDGSNDISTYPTSLLLIRNLSFATTEKMIYDHFCVLANQIEKRDIIPDQVRLIRNRETKLSYGFAFLEYPTTEACQSALEFIGCRENISGEFEVCDAIVKTSYGDPSAFNKIYTTSSHALVTKNFEILTYNNDRAYPTGYPLTECEFGLTEDITVANTGPQVVVRPDDDIDQFLASIHGENQAALQVVPQIADTEDLDLMLPPPGETFVDMKQSTCFLCLRRFLGSTIAAEHVARSALHMARLEDALAVQLALNLKYKYNWSAAKIANIQARRRMFRRQLQEKAVEREEAKRDSLHAGIGAQLLSKFGWAGGGLGKNEAGISAPLETVAYKDGAGIGASRTGTSVPATLPNGQALSRKYARYAEPAPQLPRK